MRPEAPTRPLRVLCCGELLVDFCSLQRDVPLREVSAFRRAPGGAPANVSVGLRRLGCDAAFAGAVGEDFLGTFLLDTLEREGVDTSRVLRTSEAGTTLAFIADHADGRKEVAFHRRPGADQFLSASQIPLTDLAGFDVVHFGSVSLTGTPSGAATWHARDGGAAVGALTTLDVNWRPDLWPDLLGARQRILSLAAGTHVVKMSAEEWEPVTGVGDIGAGAGPLFDRGTQLVVCTQGPQGAVLVTGRWRVEVPAIAVNAVDCLGAGDAFMAGLIKQLGGFRRAGVWPERLTREELRRAGLYAAAVAGLATEQVGVMPALPFERDVEAVLARRPGE